MSTDTNFIGNFSTMVKLISMWLAGWFIGILISHGLNLPMSQEQLSQIICSIILLAVGYVDAKYPNTILDKTTQNPTIIITEQQDDVVEDDQQ